LPLSTGTLFIDAYFCYLTDHEKYMQRCLQLAILGAGKVAPNPMVGAVLVNNNRIIGEGYHQKYGEAHAELNCLNSVVPADTVLVEKSTLYVSLEPCAHFGKTPPCANLIINHKIPHVVIGCRDSFEAVNGKGMECLKAAGVRVTFGILENECRDLNKRFFTFHEKLRPYIILKWAQSDDGKIARIPDSYLDPVGGTLKHTDSKRLMISNQFTNRLVHKWRSEEAAIMVGTNTALLDDPALTTRSYTGNNPVRLVIDMDLKLPNTLQLFDGNVKTIVFNQLKQDTGEKLSFYKIDKAESPIPQILNTLYKLQLQSVMIEGGAKLLQSFIDENAWDEARVITNTDLSIGDGINAPILQHQKQVNKENMRTDSIAYFINSKA
jgi:diaminohydroxyphosphoribosylaminopyrimidine deaminase/5-amino-6-(5-phosphoribosylamino)uracil reductase